MRRRAVVAIVVCGVLGGAGAALLGGDRDPARAPSARTTPTPPAGAVARPGPLGARLIRRTQLRRRPGGRVVRTLGTRTGFGSPRVLAVVARRGDWLAVLSDQLPNSRAGWIPATSARLLSEPYTLHADLSQRTLVVRRRGRRVRRIAIAIGRAGSTTPTGRFAVTDALVIGRRGGPYGCCALALSGRQPNVPQGWSGGDRLAIHGTPDRASIGTAASGGCLRAGERDMRWLVTNVPLGAPVRIRA